MVKNKNKIFKQHESIGSVYSEKSYHLRFLDLQPTGSH